MTPTPTPTPLARRRTLGSIFHHRRSCYYLAFYKSGLNETSVTEECAEQNMRINTTIHSDRSECRRRIRKRQGADVLRPNIL